MGMALELMYITNDPVVARIAEDAGVDDVFLDMEYIGKGLRQGGMNTVQLHHTIEDVRTIRDTLRSARLMVRVNPIHEAGEENGCRFGTSREEIDEAIEAGAEIVMLPYFKTAEEVRTFVEYVDGRVVTFPLLETPEAVERLEEILCIPGIDQIHIGLNDLSLARKSGFMFGLLTDGTVDAIAAACKEHGIPFGFGGIAAMGTGMLPAEYILAEHYRLGSRFVILSRSFCDTTKVTDPEKVREIFQKGVCGIRSLEEELQRRVESEDTAFFDANRVKVKEGVEKVRLLQSAKKRDADR